MITLLPRKIAQTTRFDYALYDLPTRQTSSSTERHTKISVELLNDRFRIGTEIANATLRSPLQRGTISAILLIIRRYRADQKNGVKRLKRKYSLDTLWGKNKSLKRNDATQVYIHKCGSTTLYHMNKANTKNTRHSLGAFISECGVLEHLTYDCASVQVGSKTIFQNHVSKHDIKTQRLSPRRKN